MNDDMALKRPLICEIRPYLFITGLRCFSYKCLTVGMIEEFGVTHIVDASNVLNIGRSPSIKYFNIKLDDHEEADIRQHATDAAAFIQEGKEAGGKVLVYCAAGVSRSATICMMYLMMNENCTLRDAYNAVGKARPIICPNLGFWRQMIAFETEKFGNSSLNLLNEEEKDGNQVQNACPIIYANLSYWHQSLGKETL